MLNYIDEYIELKNRLDKLNLDMNETQKRVGGASSKINKLREEESDGQIRRERIIKEGLDKKKSEGEKVIISSFDAEINSLKEIKEKNRKMFEEDSEKIRQKDFTGEIKDILSSKDRVEENAKSIEQVFRRVYGDKVLEAFKERIELSDVVLGVEDIKDFRVTTSRVNRDMLKYKNLEPVNLNKMVGKWLMLDREDGFLTKLVLLGWLVGLAVMLLSPGIISVGLIVSFGVLGLVVMNLMESGEVLNGYILLGSVFANMGNMENYVTKYQESRCSAYINKLRAGMDASDRDIDVEIGKVNKRMQASLKDFKTKFDSNMDKYRAELSKELDRDLDRISKSIDAESERLKELRMNGNQLEQTLSAVKKELDFTREKLENSYKNIEIDKLHDTIKRSSGRGVPLEKLFFGFDSQDDVIIAEYGTSPVIILYDETQCDLTMDYLRDLVYNIIIQNYLFIPITRLKVRVVDYSGGANFDMLSSLLQDDDKFLTVSSESQFKEDVWEEWIESKEKAHNIVAKVSDNVKEYNQKMINLDSEPFPYHMTILLNYSIENLVGDEDYRSFLYNADRWGLLLFKFIPYQKLKSDKDKENESDFSFQLKDFIGKMLRDNVVKLFYFDGDKLIAKSSDEFSKEFAE